MRHLFKMGNIDIDKRDQIAAMLEKYTENNSRAKMSKVWKMTDKLNDSSRNNLLEEERNQRKKSIDRMGLAYLIIGVLFIITQLFMKLSIWLYVIGAALIIIGALLTGPFNLSERFYKAADTVIGQRNRKEIEELFIISEDGYGFEEEKSHSLEKLSSVITSQDLIGLIHGEDFLLIQKEELVEGDIDVLLNTLKEKTKVYEI